MCDWVGMRQHPTRPNIYVTEDGEIFLRLSAREQSFGYHAVTAGKETIRRHTIVCETYHGPRPPGGVTRHLDGDPANDHPSNLCWGTQRENCQDTVSHGNSTRGIKNSQAKLTESQVVEIKTRRSSGELTTALAEEFGISQTSVSDLCNGRTWGWLEEKEYLPRRARSKLTLEQATDIKLRRKDGESVASLADEFGIKSATIYDIEHGRTWAQIEV